MLLNGARECWSRRPSCVAMGQESVGAGDRVVLQWGMGILEGETNLHCNRAGEHWNRRPSCVAMGDGSVGRGN